MAVGKFSASFKALIQETSRVTFGNLPIVNYRTGYKYLKVAPTGPMAVKYYIPDMTKAFKSAAPDFQTDIEERRFEQLDRLRRRGKGPPKKGEGKRSKRKK